MKRAAWILKFLVLGIVMLGLIGLVTQVLWNWLVLEPEVDQHVVDTFVTALAFHRYLPPSP